MSEVFNLIYTDTISSITACARIGDLKNLQKLLTDGYSSNIKDNRGWNALHYAIDGGHKECIKELIEKGNVNIDDETFEGETALHLLVSSRDNSVSAEINHEIAEILLQAGASPNGVKKGNTPYCTIFNTCIDKCNIPMIDLLLKYKVDVNQYDDHFYTCLHSVHCDQENVPLMVKLLNLKELKLFHKPHFTHTFLHPWLIALLNEKITFNILSILFKRPECVALINECDEFGCTLLHYACKNLDRSSTCIEIIDLLLSLGADPNILDKQINLPIIYACLSVSPARNYDSILLKLLEATAMSELRKCTKNKFAQETVVGCKEANNIIALALYFKRSEIWRIAFSWCHPEIIAGKSIDQIRVSENVARYLLRAQEGIFSDTYSHNVYLLAIACYFCDDEQGYDLAKKISELFNDYSCNLCPSAFIFLSIKERNYWKEKSICCIQNPFLHKCDLVCQEQIICFIIGSKNLMALELYFSYYLSKNKPPERFFLIMKSYLSDFGSVDEEIKFIYKVLEMAMPYCYFSNKDHVFEFPQLVHGIFPQLDQAVINKLCRKKIASLKDLCVNRVRKELAVAYPDLMFQDSVLKLSSNLELPQAIHNLLLYTILPQVKRIYVLDGGYALY